MRRAALAAMLGTAPTLGVAAEGNDLCVLAIANVHYSGGYATLHDGMELEQIQATARRLADRPWILSEVDVTLAEFRTLVEAFLAGAGQRHCQHVWLYYFGHGEQVPDQSTRTPESPHVRPGDEPLDGLDEALVMTDTPRLWGGDYDGSAHLLDDELASYLDRMRAVAGRDGSVVWTFDACHSGDLARGVHASSTLDVAILGGLPAAARELQGDVRFGIAGERLVDVPRDRGSSPFVVLSAVDAHAVAQQASSSKGQGYIGVFTEALVEALSSDTTSGWYGIHQGVRARTDRLLAGRRRQVPQLDGYGTLGVFGRPVDGTGGWPVRRVTAQGVSLDVGAVDGLRVGMLVHLLAPGEDTPHVVRVTGVTGQHAELTLPDDGVNPDVSWRAWPVGTNPDAVAVHATGAGARDLADALSRANLWEVVWHDDEPDWRVSFSPDRSARLLDRAGQTVAYYPSGAQVVDAILHDLVVLARVRRWQDLTHEDARYAVALTVSAFRDPECDEPLPDHAVQGGLHKGDAIIIHAHHTGINRAHPLLFDVDPLGRPVRIPLNGLSLQKPSAASEPFNGAMQPDARLQSACLPIEAPFGIDTLVFLAGKEPLPSDTLALVGSATPPTGLRGNAEQTVPELPPRLDHSGLFSTRIEILTLSTPRSEDDGHEH